MTNLSDNARPIPAPPGAHSWCGSRGWLYSPEETAAAVEHETVLLVSTVDGAVRGVTASNRAPLAALLRVETDVVELVARVDDLADRAEGASTDTAIEVAALKRRVRQLEER